MDNPASAFCLPPVSGVVTHTKAELKMQYVLSAGLTTPMFELLGLIN